MSTPDLTEPQTHYQYRLPGDGALFTPHLLPEARRQQAASGRLLALAVIIRALQDLQPKTTCPVKDRESARLLLTDPSSPWWAQAGIDCPSPARLAVLLKSPLRGGLDQIAKEMLPFQETNP